MKKNTSSTEIVELPIDKIERDITQPRKHFPDDELKVLSLSIENSGQWKPIEVSRHPQYPDQYIVLDGESRLRAHRLSAKLMAKGTIKAIIIEQDINELTGIELGRRHAEQAARNVVSLNMCFLDRADSYAKSHQLGVPVAEIAAIHGLNEKVVLRDIQIAGLPEEIRKAVNEKKCPIQIAEKILEAFPDNDIKQSLAWKECENLNTKKMSAAIDALRARLNSRAMFPEVSQAKKTNKKEYYKKVEEALKEYEKWSGGFLAWEKKWGGTNIGFFLDGIKKEIGVREVEVKLMKKTAEFVLNSMTLKQAQWASLKKGRQHENP